jgi:hypothetical protein
MQVYDDRFQAESGWNVVGYLKEISVFSETSILAPGLTHPVE